MKKNKKEKINKKDFGQDNKFSVVIVGAGETGLSLAKLLKKYQAKILLIDEEDPGIKSNLDIKLFSFIANKYKGTDTKNFLNIFNTELEQDRKITNEEFIGSILSPEESNISFIKGKVKIISNEFIEVNGEKFQYNKLVFATGSIYKELILPGLVSDMYINPSQMSLINSNIETIAIYGTNWEALELGQAFTKIGVKVYFVDASINPFNDFDDEIEAALKKDFKNNLMSWCLESIPINHERISNDKIKITLQTNSMNRFIEVDKIINTEKEPNTKHIDSDLTFNKNRNDAFIISSDFKMKGYNNFYAIGSVNGLYDYPNQSYYQAFALSRFLIKSKAKFDIYDFSFSLNINPSISFYGMNKNQIEHAQIQYNEFIYEFKNFYKTKVACSPGRVKIFTNKKHEILGVLLIGDGLEETINLFGILIKNKIKFHKLVWANIPFFSKSEFIKEASLEYYYDFVLENKKLKSKINELNKIK